MWLKRLLAVTLLTATTGSTGRADSPPSPTIVRTSVLDANGLTGSKYRHAGTFTAALATALRHCGQDRQASALPLDGRLNAQTSAAIKAVADCPGFPADGRSGDLTEALWAKLLPDIPVPNAFERAFIVTLTLEGTDYDRFEWNYDASDPTAWGTWGPYGATIGQGGEVQQILAAVDREGPQSPVRQAFERAAGMPPQPSDLPGPGRRQSRQEACATPAPGPSDDYDLFVKVAALRGAAAGEALRTAYCDDGRFGTWIRAFRILGADGRVRRAYDDLYFEPGRKVAAYIELTREAYADAGAVATAVDLAMGMDGQTQASVRADRERVAGAVRAAGPAASPARRRSSISERLPVGPRNKKDRCARAAVFFIDDLATLPTPRTCRGPGWDLRSAWRDRAGFSAGVVGLTDDHDGHAFKAGWTFDFDAVPEAGRGEK